jgi:peptidyl-tRNA hydrolase, PTH1 family
MIAGLGNPGPKYERTRHNLGFIIVEELARRLQIGNWKTKDGARQAYDSTRKIVLAEPQTYMNNSGVPLRILASWFRTPPELLLVIYDDMDLRFGRIRMKPFGGHGGHNGMRSIIGTIGDRFPRIRVGVGRPIFEEDRDDGIDHLLSPFSADEDARLPEIVDAAARGAELWLSEGLESAMQFLNNLQIA